MIPSLMNYSHGLRSYNANMYKGSSVVLLGSVLNMKRFMENLDKYQVNSIDLIPSVFSVVLRLSKNKLAEYRDRIIPDSYLYICVSNPGRVFVG